MDIILLILLVVVLLGLAGFFAYQFYKIKKNFVNVQKQNIEYETALTDGHRAVELALKYEEFYNSTVGEVGEIVDTLRAVVSKRQMLSDDPDVQNLIRIISLAHDTLLGYVNAKEPGNESRETKQ